MKERKDRLTFTLLLPTLNERQGLEAVLPRIDRSLFDEILVIDGGSTDGTVEFAEGEGLTVVRQAGTGLPDAMRHGFVNTKGDVLVMLATDGNALPEKLPELCAKVRAGYDLVVVSRYADGAKSLDDDFLTHLGNKGFTFVINFLFGGRYTDTLGGYRAMRRSALEEMGTPHLQDEDWVRRRFIYVNGWEASTSIRAARLGLKTAEIPGDEPPRIGGQRKLSIPKHGLGLVYHIMRDFFCYRPAKHS